LSKIIPQIGVTFAIGIRLRWMFGVVENKDITRWGLGGNDARVLGHVACSVDLTFVVNLDFDLNFATDGSKPTKF